MCERHDSAMSDVHRVKWGVPWLFPLCTIVVPQSVRSLLLAVRLCRSVRGDDGQVGAILETETRSALEYKDKISSF